ncbi:hypothetical protein [Nitrosopumilus sp.]|uniref:hypothetical protein n=1 Tax=Nitrosopumilus sp. TaxID=2024843 RepID=UPI00247DD15B|nr:hypothetical protein [Nitrosopumilus sp.]MCV0409631.1 hypothetical protein [Nitrosopumilus sp.]
MNSKLLLGLIVFASLIFVFNPVFAQNTHPQLPTVYQVPNAGFDKYAYTWGEQGKIFLASSLDNKDPQRIEVITSNNSTFSYEISVYPDSTRQENFILTETGPDTGLFEWDFVVSDPEAKPTYDVNSNYIIVSDSTTDIHFQFDVDSINGYVATAKITYPNDNTLPSDEQIQNMFDMYPRISSVHSIQFRNGTMISPYDGQGILTVQYPSQNKSPTTVDQLKVTFSAYDAHRIFEVLDETGPDTGVFEGSLSFSSYKSFSKIYLIKNENNVRSITAYYLVSDTESPTYSNNILLHHGLEYPDNTSGRIHNDLRLSVHSDKKAYLDDQSIKVTGYAEPDEIINVSLLSTRGSHVLFEQVHADNNGMFDTEFTLTDPSSSGKYDINAVSIKNDKQTTTQITITSIDDLKTRSIDVPPLQQSQMGLQPDEIVCKQVWKKLIKPGGESPACVTLPTYEKLLERGWHGQTNVNKTESEIMDRKYQMIADKNMMTFGEFLRVDVKIDSPVTNSHEIKVVGPDGKTHASIISESDDEHGWSFQARKNWPTGTYEIQLWHSDEKVLTSTFILQN